MTITGRFFVNKSTLQMMKFETDPIKKAGMALREYVPVEVTSFYITFFAAASGQPAGIARAAQFTIIPVLCLFATIILSIAKNTHGRSNAKKWWKKIQWGGVVVSTLSFIGWVYVTGGQFFNLTLQPFIAAILFAFLGFVIPTVYGMLQRPK